MNIGVTRSLHLSTGLPPIFNFNTEDEDQRHLCYQILAMKILIFTHMAKTMFGDSATCYMNLLCIPHMVGYTKPFASRIIARLFNTILVTSANVAPMHLFYVMALFRTIFVPGLEVLIDIYFLLSVMYFVYHNYLTPQLLGSYLAYAFRGDFVLFHNVSLQLRLLTTRLTLEVYKYVKKIGPLAWIYLPCSFIIWTAFRYGKMNHETEQEWICKKFICLSITTQFYTNISFMEIGEIQTRYEL